MSGQARLGPEDWFERGRTPAPIDADVLEAIWRALNSANSLFVSEGGVTLGDGEVIDSVVVQPDGWFRVTHRDRGQESHVLDTNSERALAAYLALHADLPGPVAQARRTLVERLEQTDALPEPVLVTYDEKLTASWGDGEHLIAPRSAYYDVERMAGVLNARLADIPALTGLTPAEEVPRYSRAPMMCSVSRGIADRSQPLARYLRTQPVALGDSGWVLLEPRDFHAGLAADTVRVPLDAALRRYASDGGGHLVGVPPVDHPARRRTPDNRWIDVTELPLDFGIPPAPGAPPHDDRPIRPRLAVMYRTFEQFLESMREHAATPDEELLLAALTHPTPRDRFLIASWLLAQGVSARITHLMPPIITLVKQPRHDVAGTTELVRGLIAAGADPARPDWRGEVALHEAIRLDAPERQKRELYELLLHPGAADKASFAGQTPRSLAAATPGRRWILERLHA